MKIDAKSCSLRDILSHYKVYFVPDYQRPYSWTKDEIEDLFSDIYEVIQTDKNLFFGAMVFHKKDDKKISIIDGQQRLLTIAIFLYVIKYFYFKLQQQINDSEINSKIAYRIGTIGYHLEEQDNDGDVKGIRIIPGEINKEFYKRFVVDTWKEDISRKIEIVKEFKSMKKFESTKNIYEAYMYIFDELNKEFNGKIEFFEKLKKIQDTILDKFEVVTIEVGDEGDAFKIFETLNDRGLELSSADLIKNYLYSLCSTLIENEFEESKKYWLDMINRAENISLVKYIRHYWIAFQSHVTKDTLFDEIKKSIKNAQEAKKLLFELNKNFGRYIKLIRPSQDSFDNTEIIYYLSEMNEMNFDLVNPILLKALYLLDNNSISEDDFLKILKISLSFLIRYIVVMKEKPSKIEKKIGELARMLNKKSDIQNISHVYLSFAPDDSFKEIIKTISLKESDSTYFILKEIERYLRKKRNLEAWRSPGRKEVNIEHILPKEIENTKWKDYFNDEEHDVYVNKLGNLTLLGEKLNKSQKNSFFDKKKDFYKKSTIVMTMDLENYSSWGIQEIQLRQNYFADIITEVFSLK